MAPASPRSVPSRSINRTRCASDQRANLLARAVNRAVIDEDDFAERNVRLLDLFH